MKRNMYTLVLNIQLNDVDYTEFEPLSVWLNQGNGTANVHQKVYLDGGRLFGESDRYHEGLSDVVRDFDRFVSLTPIKE